MRVRERKRGVVLWFKKFSFLSPLTRLHPRLFYLVIYEI